MQVPGELLCGEHGEMKDSTLQVAASENLILDTPALDNVSLDSMSPYAERIHSMTNSCSEK